MPNIKVAGRLAGLVQDGTKRQLIVDTLQGVHSGYKLVFFKGVVEIGRAECRNVVDIAIFEDHIFLRHPTKGWESKLEGPATLDQFAHRDGFADWRDLLNWYKAMKGLPVPNGPYTGYLIVW